MRPAGAALRIYAGPAARAHVARSGLVPEDIRLIPAAAGGPKGLILGPIDRFLFGHWLASSSHEVHLVGASIGAWRMATACLGDSQSAFARLEHDYIRQHYEPEPGRKRPRPEAISALFGQGLKDFYDGHVPGVLHHPRYRLHVVTSRGRHLLRRERPVRTPLGYLGAYLTNTVSRRALGAWIERVVFSSPGHPLPVATRDFRTRQLVLTTDNFMPALQASCSIPFVLRAVHDIEGGPPGAYWDGGITDYHLHLDYASLGRGLVLYPHFQRAVVPGWLDKALRWRHGATPFLDNTIVLAPDPEWVRRLPRGKLPDRNDFTHFGNNLEARVKAWTAAASAARQLADELQQWLEKPDPARLEPL